ncbi:uncharacterized protein H6S33_007294 [Morchella sextelata]|uniref:uncharacterized protein n=1 Tax=Morchella sextelata TaxID=1174677 RepID=UPI001D048CA2|nr:uncharacterized protein H6S33_007294 [Morchella sextelata]KAH0603635.1 hypothetical protein H6S33_007294 [Morchella sextelata]
METRTKKTQSSWEKKFQDSKRVITAGEWETQRNNFTRLYITDDLGLEKVRQIMAERHGFFANEKQCKTIIKRWGLRKYLRKNNVTEMLDIQQARAQKGKKTEFRLHGQPITEKRFERAKGRRRREEKGLGLGSPINDMVTTTNTPQMAIEYSTPEPTPSLPDTGVVGEMSIPNTEIFVHDILNLPTKRNTATSSTSAFSAFAQDVEANNEHPLTNVVTPFNTRDIDHLSTSSQNLYLPLLSTPAEERHINKADDILAQSLPPPLPPTLNPSMLTWEPMLSSLDFSLSSVRKELYCACFGIPYAPQVDYSTVILGSTYIDDSNMQMYIKNEINRTKECLANMSEKLAALMEEQSFLFGLGPRGPSKVTLTLELVKDKDILESDLSRRYRAEQLVVLGWQCEMRSNGLSLMSHDDHDQVRPYSLENPGG